MGNRAYVIFHDTTNDEISPATYLHWDGGPESIYAFLDELDRRKIRPSTVDVSYESARFAHIVGDFFDSDATTSLSLGVRNGPSKATPRALKDFADEDNGLYLVTRSREGRTVRRFFGSKEMTAEEVTAERDEAYATGRPAAIADTFRRLRPVVRGE